jgi:class 3 adenylate cyclase
LVGVFEVPKVQYADSPGGLIAYQTIGEAPVDLVHIAGWAQTVEGIWELPTAERFYRRLASFGRVVLVDRRGTGLSDPLRSVYAGGDFGPWLEEAVSDFVTVLDVIGSERAALVSSSYGTPVAISLAATYPDRVAALVLVDPLVRLLATEDYPWGMTREMRQETADAIRIAWGEGWTSGLTRSWRGPGRNPSFGHDPEAHRWSARYERAGQPRGHVAAWWSDWDFDVRALLPSIQAPTLVMCHDSNVFVPPMAAIKYVVAAIPRAVGPVTIPSRDMELWASQPPMLADEIERFLTGSTGEHLAASDRAFAVVLYTDLVESTDQASAMGDRRWRELLEVHHSASVREIERHRGRLVKSTGDGVLAVFDAPARAVRCAQAILGDIHQLGCEAYAGLHAGEVELLGDDIAGIAVHIAARVMSHAAPGEVLVSRTITDLVAGSGLRFEDRGVHTLKGIPEQWQLFAVLV